MLNAAKVMFATAIGEVLSLATNQILLYDALIAVYTVIITTIFYIIFSEAMATIYKMEKMKITSSENLMAVGILLTLMPTS